MNHIKVYFALFGIVVTSTILGIVMYEQGVSSVSMIVAIILSLMIAWTVKQQKIAARQPLQLLKALANGDTNLGLNASHPLKSQLDEVSSQLKLARLEAASQANYFQALLQQIDVGVLVIAHDGNVTNQNVASARLIGKKVTNISALPALEEHLKAVFLQPSYVSKRFTIPWLRGDQQDTLTMSLVKIEVAGELLILLTFVSINMELKAKEQQAYKQLTLVLTHEVANSITPLSSLADTAKDLLPKGCHFDNQEDKEDLDIALTTISQRTQHLGDFISRFRKVNNVPTPNTSPCELSDLTTAVYRLMQQECEKNGVRLIDNVTYTQLLMVDAIQIEQVLINLIVNSIEAAVEKFTESSGDPPPCIVLQSGQNLDGQIYIDISDSGADIVAHSIEHIFVPFYTTKPNGSGIGLTLARKIMALHGGDLVYMPADKRKNEQDYLGGSCFRMVF